MSTEGSSRGYRRPEVVSVSSKDTVFRAVERMHAEHVGFLVVLDDAGKLEGVLTDRDVATRVVARVANPEVLLVGDVMTRPVVVLESGQGRAEAARRMRRNRIRRLPVVDVTGRVVGVVSSDDVMKQIGSSLSALDACIQREFHNEEVPPPHGSDPLLGKE